MGGKGKMGKGKGMRPMRYFASSGPEDDCSSVPDDVMMGSPETAACAEAEEGAETCVCIARPPGMKPAVKRLLMLLRGLNEINDGGDGSMEKDMSMSMMEDEMMPGKKFMNVCGKCEDPCALRMRPDRSSMKKGAMNAAKEMSKVGMQLMEMLMKELNGAMEEEDQQ